jgi:hypothetical protein
MAALHKLDVHGDIIEMTPAEIASLPMADAAPPAGAGLSPSQLAIALMLAGKIDADEAKEFAGSGAIPPSLMASIGAALASSGLSAQARDIIEIKLRGALEYRRTDPAVPIIGAALGLDDAALDALWAAGAQA